MEKMDLPEVILLLDFDRRGKEGMKKLIQNLERTKTKPNFKFWHKLKTLLGKEIQCIESLTTYIKTLHLKTSTS
jgi:5S rRNA maturation endonuclease (ribonuclease M5)